MSDHTDTQQVPEANGDKPVARKRKHLIKPTWLRRTIKVLTGIIIFILLLPVLVYVPFIQDWLKDAACYFASRSTGMTVQVDKFRLKFPLDVQLDGVLVLNQKGDTLVQARSLIADVKLLPLFKLDAQINRVSLLDGKYIMVSEDSSMTMRLQAGSLQFEEGSNVNLKSSQIALKRPVLKNADISVDIDVWKEKPDSVVTPNEWIITADRLCLENVRYRMSMLPIFKDLDVTIGHGTMTDAVIDLKHYDIHAKTLDIQNGKAKYIVPTDEYIATHPEPVDTITPPTPPYTIKIDKAHLGFDYALYSVDGTKPVEGFDPYYIEATDIDISLDNFYNRETIVKLPITSIRARERSGLRITSGSGSIDIDSIGINLRDIGVSTPYSTLNGNAYISYALMDLNPDAPMSVNASGSIGFEDIYAYMPSLKSILSKLPNRNPLEFEADIKGTLSSITIRSLNLTIQKLLGLKASGQIDNPMDMKKLRASIDLDGSLRDARAFDGFFGSELSSYGIKLPTFSIKGHIGAEPEKYEANLSMVSSAGDASLKGNVAIGPESYNADVTLHDFDVSAIMPSFGVGKVTGSLSAKGAGFNPMNKGANTDIYADVKTLVYGGKNLAPLTLDATLNRGDYDIDFEGRSQDLNLALTATGSIKGNTIYTDMNADILNLSLDKLGFTDFPCHGSAVFTLNGFVNTDNYFCNLDAGLTELNWTYEDNTYTVPDALDAKFISEAKSTVLGVYGTGLDFDLTADAPLKSLFSSLPNAFSLIMKQIDARNLDMETIGQALPPFNLSLGINSTGLISNLIAESGYKFDNLSLSLSNDSLFSGNMRLMSAGTSSLTLDTVTLNLNQRGKMLDYKLHVGNAAQNLPDFANVNLTGYIGSNRMSAYLRQRDNKGEEGYRLGLTAAFGDSIINLHLTPLAATIAYKPWEINDDNYIQVGPGSRIHADLTATSGSSSVRLLTPERTDSLHALQVQIKNLRIEDFLQMSVLAPPVTGALNSDLTLVYRGKAITGTGTLGVKDLSYNRQRIGDIDFNVKAGMGFSGNSGGSIGMLLNGREVLVARGYMITDTVSATKRVDGVPTAFELEMKQFPLSIANAFLSPDYMQLTGNLNGKMKMTGKFTSPVLNGSLSCDSVGIRIPMAGSTIYFDSNTPVTVENNVLRFNNFNIYGVNHKPVVLSGSVDARNISNILVDMSMNGNDVALVNNNNRNNTIYGKLFMNLNATAKGPLSMLDINADLSIQPATNIFYTYASTSTQIQGSSITDVVKFVQFSDSIAVTPEKSAVSSMNMRINANLSIVNGAKATVNLAGGMSGKVTLSPYGNLSYTQNYMGDMRLNGSLFLGTGFVRYSVPLIGEKTFDFNEGSNISWNGELMNPGLYILATDHVKANVQQEGMNSRLIYFDVGLSVLGNLDAPKVTFDLSTDDDITVRNELLSMSPEQRSAAAIHLLLYNTYTGLGVKANANLSNPLYSFLEGQLNSWAAKNIKGVDLSFGIDQYQQTLDGQKDNTTSYSYQVSKSLFDNRFKIIVGGNYSTDADADENFAQNLISDISFEYSLKQTKNLNMYLKLFRHTGYESILEGEITETGVGFVMRRKLSNLRSLFRFGRKRKNRNNDKEPAGDSLPENGKIADPALVPLSNDTIINEEAPIEK